jgi:hypothetical protein
MLRRAAAQHALIDAVEIDRTVGGAGGATSPPGFTRFLRLAAQDISRRPRLLVGIGAGDLSSSGTTT